MGQKVHPYRIPARLQQDLAVALVLRPRLPEAAARGSGPAAGPQEALPHAGVARIETERAANKLKIDIYTSRPGIIIGRKGTEVDKLKQEIQKRTSREVFINIQEIQKPELEAQLIAESVAVQLEKRVAFRRAMRKAVESALRFGARGIKVRVSGRLNGAGNRAVRVVSARPAAAADAARGHRLRLRGSQHDLRPDRREGVALQGRAPGAARRPRRRAPRPRPASGAARRAR